MKILGLTGDIASGKSSVARILVGLGVAHLDADLLVREVYSQPEFAQLLTENFGDVLSENGEISRMKLGVIVFSDAGKLHELESFVHPAVADLRAQKLEGLRKSGVPFVVLEAVKLLESGQGRGCDVIWCVTAAPQTQMERLVKNRGLSHEEAQARLMAQPSRERKMELAGETPLVWIPNDEDLTALASKVQTLWREFQEL